MKKWTLIIAVYCFVSTGALFAQFSIQHIGEESEVTLTQQGIFTVPAELGAPILESDTIRSENSQFEFLTVGENSALVINENSEVSIPPRNETSNADAYSLSLESGKIRSIVAENSTPLEIQLGTTRVIARSGEFIAGYNDDGSLEVTTLYGDVSVVDESLEIDEAVSESTALMVSDGAPLYLEQGTDQLAEKLREIPFQGTNIGLIPGYQQVVPPELTNDTFHGAQELLNMGTADTKPRYNASEWVPDPKQVFGLNLSVGSITIGNLSYGVAHIKPKIKTKSLTATFNIGLAIRSGTDATNIENWYSSKGNFDWDFGFGYFPSDPVTGAFDLINDLLLKIDVLEIYTKEDPVYIRLGKLEPMYISTGSLIGGFSNSPDYPVRRQSGAYIALDFEKYGLLAFAESLTNRSLYGGRFYVKPGGDESTFRFGFTALADLGLNVVVEGYPDGTEDELSDVANPLRPFQIAKAYGLGYLAGGLDVWISILFMDPQVLNLVFDSNVFLPFIVSNDVYSFVDNSIWEPVTQSLPGLSSLVGVAGNSKESNDLVVSYLVAFQYLGSITKPRTANLGYDRTRLNLVQPYLHLFDISANNASQDQMDTIASYSFGARFDLRLTSKQGTSLEAGYFLPLTIKNETLYIDGAHELYLNLTLSPVSWPLTISMYTDLYDIIGIFSGRVPLLSEFVTLGASVIVHPFNYLSFEVRGGITVLEDENGNYAVNPSTNEIESGGLLLFLINLHL